MKRAALMMIILLAASTLTVQAVDIKWTPNEEPRPSEQYTAQERQMLLQLEQHITSAADPRATLEQVAASNQMEPQQLVEILQENRQYLQQHGGGGMAQSQPQPMAIKVVRALTSLLALLWQTALTRPRATAVVLLAASAAMYVSQQAPRNGVVLPGPQKKGPTTWFAPPTDFVETTLLQRDYWEPSTTTQRRKGLQRQAGRRNLVNDEDDDGKVWKVIEKARNDNSQKGKKKKKKQTQTTNNYSNDESVQWFSSKQLSSSSMTQVATMQRVLSWDDLLPPSSKKSKNDDDDDDVTQLLLQEVGLEQAVRLLSSSQPQLTEFSLGGKAIKFFSSDDDEQHALAVLMVPGLGQFGRMAYLPLTMEWPEEEDSDEDSIVEEGDDEDEEDETFNPLKHDPSHEKDTVVVASLMLRTLPGTYWEGQDIYIRIVLQQDDNNSDDTKLVTQVALTSKTRGGRKTLPKSLANNIVSTLATSIQSSLQTRTQQAFVRLSQSARFKGRAKQAAQQKRNTRSSLERQLEEMAADRRRRRFQQNPDQGRYRPSGDRMRSPNNAVY